MTNHLLTTIPDFMALEITGGQAAQFLQGQFTCDVRTLQSGQAILGACCDHKGRMLFNGWIGRWQDTFIVFLPKNMAAAAQQHLQKFAVFSKVTLHQLSDWTALNYSASALPSLPGTDFIHSQLAYPQSPECYLHWFIGPSASIASIHQALAQPATLIDFSSLERLRILNHLVFVQPSTQALFIPQMIDLEKLGGVSFTKGCYVGQEVVARTQHLGQLKRHLQTIHSSGETRPQVGDPLFDGQNETIGHIAAVSVDLQDGYLSLAVIQDRALSAPIFNSNHQAVSIASIQFPPLKKGSEGGFI